MGTRGKLGVQRVPQGRGLGGKEAFQGAVSQPPSWGVLGTERDGQTERQRCREKEVARESGRGKEKIKVGDRDTETRTQKKNQRRKWK